MDQFTQSFLHLQPMHSEIKTQLEKLGFETTAQGEVSLSGSAKKAHDRWCQLLTEMFTEKNTIIYSNPLMIDEQTLHTSKYSEHFPHQLVNAVSKNGDQIACCTPASCLHIYPRLQGSNIDEMKTYLVRGICARFEEGKWETPFRLPFFNMLEYVAIGKEAEVKEQYDRALKTIEKLFTDLNIKGKYEFATDAFFLAGNEGAKLIQELKGLKREYIGIVGNNPVALASLNYHEDYFSKNFSITRDNLPAFSICIAFGIERLTAYSLLTWGEEKDWPKKFQHE